ncbi:MAG: single-stranded DNA-binding protein [Saprospiraceae bacterium]|jgi:single-strand DNA-binding protein|nr:single-stranded DNA-binding protein [Saprospiraceae bacterium]MBP9195530.1 single-stranded DNA-binding protein [Saprospiraceae bacterium]
MKAIRNSVHLLGNLGKDVEMLTFGSNMKKATVSLATTEYYKNQKGELVKNTQWHNLVAWGKTAEIMASQLLKGNTIALHGSIQYRSYEANGQTRQITEIVIDEFMKIGRSSESASEEKTNTEGPFGEPQKAQ